MHTLRSLTQTYRRALAVALAASPGLSSCGDVGPGIADDPDFVPVPCDGEDVRWLADLAPEPPVDFIKFAVGPDEQWGEPCATASDMDACLSHLPANSGSAIGDQNGFRILTGADLFQTAELVATRADTVVQVDSFEALQAFLGTVDTPGEAMLLTQASSYNVECKGGGARPSDDGFDVQAYAAVGCGGRDRFLVHVAADGSVSRRSRTRVKDPERNCVVGRRPAGLRSVPARARSDAAHYLARASTLEAASVVAFRRLARELCEHGAPPALVAMARAAARDEVRHARTTAQLARIRGAEAERPRIAPMCARSLEEMARENAVEGCVRESYGVLEGRWQALHARDADLRRAYARIADDELRHASLAWSVARFIMPRLDIASRARVRASQRAAVSALREQLRREPEPEIREVCGVPSARQAALLFETLAETLG